MPPSNALGAHSSLVDSRRPSEGTSQSVQAKGVDPGDVPPWARDPSAPMPDALRSPRVPNLSSGGPVTADSIISPGEPSGEESRVAHASSAGATAEATPGEGGVRAAGARPDETAVASPALSESASSKRSGASAPSIRPDGSGGLHRGEPARKVEQPEQVEGGASNEAGTDDAPTDHDETSVPPAGDLTVDEAFFSEGNLARHMAAEALEATDALTVPEEARRGADPAIARRRERLVRLVKWSVGACAAVCLVAISRTLVAPQTSLVPMRTAAAVVVTPNAASEAPVASKAAAPAAAPVVVDPPPAPAAAAPVVEARTAAPAAESSSVVLTVDAKEEKARSRALLEMGKIAEAIGAGERSVAVDPTDGEAWLILGAAYQESGNMAEARRAYAACRKEGKTGPRGECAKMLR